MDFQLSPVIGILSAAWLLMFLYARSQTERIKKNTVDMILERARIESKREPCSTMEQFYADFQQDWEKMLHESAVVILHKSELFPLPAKPEVVRRRLNLTPAWMGAYLRLHGFRLKASPELDEQIQQIMILAPTKKTKR
jgi:hypothetical protein